MSVGTPEDLAGEWLINASILNCHNAVSGRVVFTDCGEIVYLAEGGDLIGRGVGHWVSEGPVVGFQVDIFQYAGTSAKHVHTDPHQFRGIARFPAKGEPWIGEWHFCGHKQPPRCVGVFQAARRQLGPLKSTSDVKAPADFPTEAKTEKSYKLVVAKLEKFTEWRPMSEPRWLPHAISGEVDGIYLVRKFLEPTQAEDLERTIDSQCVWESMNTRSTQEFGTSQRCPCGRSLAKTPLPPWLTNMSLALHNLGVFHPVLYPVNSVRLNAYKPGQGIHPHMDGPVYFPRVAIVSLGSHCIFDFYPREEIDEETRPLTWDRDKDVPSAPEMPAGTKPKMSILLEPGSLLVFSDEAFICHRHGIQSVEEDVITPEVKNCKELGLSVGDELRRGRRISLTVRHLLPHCMCNSTL